MVLEPNDKIDLVRGALDYIEIKFRAARRDLSDEANPDSEGRLDDVYVAGRDAAAKTNVLEGIQMLRWLIEDHFGLSPPAAYTDAEVDAINPRIRQKDVNLLL